MVGHSLKSQLDSLGLDRIHYIDIQQNFRHKSDQKGIPKSLKQLVKTYLNEDVKTSSIEEARATMTFFMEFKENEEGFFGEKTILQYDREFELSQADLKDK